MSTAEKIITDEIIRDAMDYQAYRTKIDDLLEEGKTTGPNQSEDLTEYTRMNVHRMKRLDKQVQLRNSLKEKLHDIQQSYVWLVITEGWCGDAAQNLPVIAKMADETDAIDLKLILRDENLDIMDEFLTNGGRSIPKLICLDAETLEVKGSWGPRPQELQKGAMKWKENPDISNEEWAERVHKWYAVDKANKIQDEFEVHIDEWTSN